jgi:hypothetical protein
VAVTLTSVSISSTTLFRERNSLHETAKPFGNKSALHAPQNNPENDYDWIQDFYYCSDYVDWRDKLCKCPVPDVGDSKSGFVSGAIPQ